jgi:hypothetical protein
MGAPHTHARTNRRRAAWLAALGCALAATAARADDPQEEARRLFMAGRQAYQAGRLSVAASSFEMAMRLAPRPALYFNLAQVHRKQYAVDADPRLLERAMDEYRTYVRDAGEDAPNRDAATQALVELQAIAARVAASAPAPARAEPTVERTQLMVVTEAEGAEVRLDGKPLVAAPLLADVAPGMHLAVVQAPGYAPTELHVVSVAGRLVTAEARLVPLPGRLTVRTQRGARVWVDERAVGRAPLAPLALPPGTHTVSVGARGRQLFRERLTLERGGARTVRAELAPTTQRRVAHFLLGLSIASLLATAAAGGVFAYEDHAAGEIDERRVSGQITPAELSQYVDDRARRDAWATGTYIAAGISGALLIATGAVYLFDQPSVAATVDATE